MLLHELRNETYFAEPENRARVLTKKGMYPNGTCIVQTPEGRLFTMDGGAVVVVPEPTKEVRR
ncbi:MAG: hypothetical protein Q7R86_03215 [bacterium]|nr:hypothetical protein [bacterium]